MFYKRVWRSLPSQWMVGILACIGVEMDQQSQKLIVIGKLSICVETFLRSSKLINHWAINFLYDWLWNVSLFTLYCIDIVNKLLTLTQWSIMTVNCVNDIAYRWWIYKLIGILTVFLQLQAAFVLVNKLESVPSGINFCILLYNCK